MKDGLLLIAGEKSGLAGLPERGMAMAVKAGNYENALFFYEKEQAVRKASNSCPAIPFSRLGKSLRKFGRML